ncbi:MAG: fluoride efflux transporter CrcB [Deltaproteobacteria bacterium]|nr:fluoride efflux transporter CrcB [Deltaproteobacteria bacterium]MCB9788843.1 fluoride efflux transporter CrcB [Deltaproteobacteria bacterium]
MRDLIFIAGGGALGALARYGVAVQARRLWGVDFPWGTLLVNLLGCLLLGAVLEAARIGPPGANVSRGLQVFLAVGFLGAFTTFSTFGVESVSLFMAGKPGEALAYVIGSVALGLAGSAAGILVMRTALG